MPAGAPYAGEHTLQFNGFFVGDFGAILASIRGEVNADDAKRLRAMYGKGDQAKVNERVAALTVRNGDLVDAADLRPVVPVELFPLHVLLAALNVYAASPPHAQRGTVDKVAVLGELARRFFAGGKKFGAVRQEHVDAVLTTAVPVADAEPLAPSALPGDATNVSAFALRDWPSRLRVTWSPPAQTFGSPVDRYRVQWWASEPPGAAAGADGL